MAGGGANGQQGIVVAKPPKKPKHRLTYKALTVYDDLVTETLVDNVSAPSLPIDFGGFD